MEINNIELQNIPSVIEGLHLVAVIGRSPDGWRCYEAAVVMPSMLDPDFEAKWGPAKKAAAAYTMRYGNKLTAQQATRYFPSATALPFAS